MKIAFDNQTFIDQAYGGVSRYACELATRLDGLPDTRARVFAPLHRNAYLDAAPRRVRGTAFKLPFVKHTSRLIRLASKALAAPALAAYSPDILHRTYYQFHTGRAGKARTVLTVYDMIHERFANLFPNEPHLSAQKRRAVAECDHVICISRQTQIDLIELFSVPPQKTSVVYLGFECGSVAPGDRAVVDKLTGGRPYILYVGSRSGYKNFHRLAQAYAASARLRAGWVLLCFGGGAFTPAEREQLEELGIADGQCLQAGGGDELLNSMYAGADVFVYPSLYEGFGIPPLEAMALDCPVICGDQGSIPEVVGEAALRCDVQDSAAIRSALEQLLDDPTASASLRAAGRERCRQFSWDACARQTRKIYEELL